MPTITTMAKVKTPDTPYRPHASGSVVPAVREMTHVNVCVCVCVYMCAGVCNVQYVCVYLCVQCVSVRVRARDELKN